MLILKTNHIQELIGNKHTVANVIDDLTVIDHLTTIDHNHYSLYVVINSRFGSTEVFTFDMSREKHRVFELLLAKELYTFYDVKCQDCGSEYASNYYMLSIRCAECHKRVSGLDNFDGLKELLKSGKIIKEIPRWRWVK